MSPDRDPEVPHTNPLDRLLRRENPYDGFFQHAAKVAECTRLLKEGYAQYAEGRYDDFQETSRRIHELEHEADVIKSGVRAHLPKGLFMSVDRSDYERLLHYQDGILDTVEDLAERMSARPTPIPEAIQGRVHELVDGVVATIDTYESAVERFADVLATGFGGPSREEVKELVKDVHAREFEADKVRFKLLREIYAHEDQMKPLDVMHLVLFADMLDTVADEAEGAADWLRALIAE